MPQREAGASRQWMDDGRLYSRRCDVKKPQLTIGYSVALTSCAVPECRGISHADATFREALWDRFFTAAPRPRTPSELLYSDRRLRSKSSPAATILIRKR